MAPGISYDDSGSLASYFAVTFLAVILTPATWFILRPAKKDPLQPLCHCSQCKSHQAQIRASNASERRRRQAKRVVPLVLGWLAFAYLCRRIALAPKLPGAAVYDPFEILGLSSSTDERGIKKHYKRLSLQFHPDKIKLAINQTMEEVESKFVDLTKAYKALTDEVTRDNLAKYGNPDGPQQREDKIAIPKWVVEGKNSIWVLAAYGLLLGGGIPFVVGRWWFRQRRTTRDNVLNGTAEYFFYSLRDDTDFINLVTIFAGAKEFEPLLDLKGKVGKKERKEEYSHVEELEKALDARREELALEESITIKPDSRIAVGSASQRKARVLIWAHLLRYKLEKADAEYQHHILRTSQPLLTALANISQAHGWLNTSLLCLRLQSALTQSVPVGASPIAQLPGIDLDRAEELQVKYDGKKWAENFAAKETGEAATVAMTWPSARVENAEFKVEGETVVPPSSIVNLVFNVGYTSEKGSAEATKTGYAHAPHWPNLRKPHYSALLGDSKLDKVIVPPIRITDIPTTGQREFKLTFPAPPQPNVYSFVLHLVSDTFVGGDVQLPVLMTVQEPPQVEDIDEEDDISEPEEDSLAGQMAMMKGGNVKASPVYDSESEYESSSDEDTPRRGKAINEDSDSDSD